ncbi:MAG TPA: tetratricopeptide repeat protein [Candidatus Margulisiibacteriota bacterium]|nr:tetratricopeptide repeat protein [Candidatus Margulisiibacteriota bacterium]
MRRTVANASLLFPVLIAVAVFITFVPIVHNDFVNWDDPFYFVWNDRYRGLSFTNIKWMFTTLDFSHYQPLTWFTHGMVYTVWGLNPTAFHLGNLVMHIANAVVLYYLLAHLLARRYPVSAPPASLAVPVAAAVGALFFALHPLRVEPVAWATERQGVTSAFFWLLAVYAYLRRQEYRDARSRRGWYVLSIGCFILSLLAKSIGMTLPIVLLVLDVYPLRRIALRLQGLHPWLAGAAPPGLLHADAIGDTRRTQPRKGRHSTARGEAPGDSGRASIVVEKLPYLVAAAAAGVLALQAKQARSLPSLAEHGMAERVVQATYGLCFYIWKTLLPTQLSPVYLLERPLNPLAPAYVASLVVVAVVTVVLIALYRRWPWALAAWVCYALILFPVLGFTQSGVQKVADRYTYLGCLPWAALVAAGTEQAWRSLARRGAGAVAAGCATLVLLLAMLGMLAALQTRVWRDSLSMWDRVIEVEPRNHIAFNFRGTARRSKGDLSGARADFERAVQLNPGYWEALVNRAHARRVTGDLDGAIADYNELIRRDPRYAYGFNGRGRSRQAKGDLQGAVADFNQAIALAAPGSKERAEFEQNLNAVRRIKP